MKLILNREELLDQTDLVIIVEDDYPRGRIFQCRRNRQENKCIKKRGNLISVQLQNCASKFYANKHIFFKNTQINEDLHFKQLYLFKHCP